MQAGLKLSGRYALQALLGSGGMGEVWRGVDEYLERPVAVKVLREHLADPELVARFRREARISALLQHPGITVVHDVGSDSGRLFIVMELLHGRDLAAVLAGAPAGLTVDAAISLVMQAAEALQAAHAAQVIHRDLKPANLFVLGSGQLKICDFGIAQAVDSTVGLTAAGQAIGTPAYMSPEQCHGQHVDARSDLYSLGCVLYALLTGRPPFADGPPLAVMSQHLYTVPAAPRTIRPDIPVEVDRLVLELLAKEPQHRPAAASHVIAALQALSYTPTVRAEPDSAASSRLDPGPSGHLGHADDSRSAVTGRTGPPPVQLARIARVPRTKAERRHVLLALDPGWEFAHFAGQLLYERDSAEAKHRDREVQSLPQSREVAAPEDLASCIRYVDERFTALRSLALQIGTTINMNDRAAIEYAFGAQGEDGDPERLTHLARRWNGVYEGFLDWAASLRRFSAPAELRNLLELAARYADEPLEKYRQFVEEYAAQVNEFPARIAAGEPLTIEGSIVLVGSKEIVQAYTDELSRLKNRLLDQVQARAQVDQLEGGSRSSGGHESGSAESPPASDDGWAGLPPAALTENDHILVWWLPDYDEAIGEVVAEYQWAWQIPMLERLEVLVPESVLRAWRDSDPFCREYAWQNVLLAFAWGRAVQLGICSRPAARIECCCCSREFLESDLSHRAIARLGADALDVCERCLREAFYAGASAKATPGVVIAVLQALSGALGRPVRSTEINGKLDLRGLSRDARGAAVRALRVRPALARVTELFGSWEAAVAQAAAAAPVPLPRYDIAKPLLPADSEFTSGNPADYRSLMGPPVEVFPDASRDPQVYREEISSLIGAGYLALAEAALVKLSVRHDVFHDLLARVYGQTAREGQALDAIDAFSYRLSDRERDGARAHLLQRRDIRTIVPGPAFYEPLASLPRGNVRFVLIGGPMEYVDRRGVHTGVTGEDPPGGAEAGRAESVARMSAMVDGAPWMRAATQTGQAILKSLSRAETGPRLYGHQLSYVTSPFRQIVKELTGSVPKKVAEDAWTLAPPAKSGWSYQREAAHYLFNAAAGFRYLTVQAAPAVCIWGWPDRSVGCLQAFLDTAAAEAADPVTVIVPDVPAFRDFARRYVRTEPMTSCGRTLIEDHLYRMPPAVPNKRGTILSAEFAPRLVIHPDGSEDDGLLLTGALAYLDAHHTLRFSVWDLLRDALLRAVAMTAPPAPQSFALSASDRTDMVSWYGRNTEYDEPDVLRPYRPTLLDAAIAAQASLVQ